MQADKKNVPTFHVYLPDDLSKEAFIHWTDPDGRRRRKKGGINREKTLAGRRAAAERLLEYLRRNYVPPVTDVAAAMLEWVERNKGRWRKKTYQTNRSRVEGFIKWLDGRGVTGQLLKLYFEDLIRRRHARTHNDQVHLFRRILRALGRPELCEGLETAHAVSTPAKYFQRHQIEKIKTYLLEADPEMWLVCEFVYYCFIRPGELRLLKVGDIHFDEWKICVRSVISKNKKEQYVTIPAAFRPSLERLKRRSASEYVFFRNDATKPVGVNYFANKFRKVLRVLGFGLEYKLYSFKHTGAVACVRAGVGLKELQIQLRHHSLEEVDKYIRQLGVNDLKGLEVKFPAL